MPRMISPLMPSSLRIVCATTALFLATLAIGCHPFGGRWRNSPANLDPSADDDWAPPKTNSYLQPQRFQPRQSPTPPGAAGQVRNRPDASPSLQSSVSRKIDEQNESNPPTATVAHLSDRSPDSSVPDIRDTGEEEIDIEGALALLPPNLRSVWERQVEAMKNPTAAVSARISDRNDAKVIAASASNPKADESNDRASDSSVVTAVAINANDSQPVMPASVQRNEPEVSSRKATIESDSEQESAEATAAPPSASSRTHWKPFVGEAIAKLERELVDRPAADENLQLSHELTLRLLYLANRQLNEAMRPIDGLDEREQGYFNHQFQALHEAANPDAMPVKSRRWSTVMNSQRKATNQLAAASNLEIKSLAFCTDVQGYGVVTKFPSYQFKPDQEILLYCELENVLAEEVKAGFETQLQGTYEIIDPNGRRIADQLLPMEREICQNHRRDYFIIYHIFMPLQIPPGNYQMRVTIEDMKARKFGQSTLDFQIQK